MLDAHTELAIPPETYFGAAIEAFQRGGAESAVEVIVQSQEWGDYNLSADEFARRVENRHPTGMGDVMRVFYQFYAERQGKPRWGSKNLAFITRMTSVYQLLPEARFVHIIRDGRDVALSAIPVWFGPNTVAESATRWERALRAARRQAQDLPFYTEITYEDLVLDTSTALKRLCHFIEVDWEPSMLDYHLHSAQRLSAEFTDRRRQGRIIPKRARLEIHRLVGHPPQPDRVQRWRREMSAADLRTFESIAGETLEEFGYELSESEPGQRPGSTHDVR